jgi:hypothetical protein
MEDAMDGGTRVDLQGVVAPLNFMMPMAEKPYSYNYDPPPGVPARNGQLFEHNVTVHDARPVNDMLSLDREGFILLRHQTAAADLYDETIITSLYYRECELLMKQATGARRAVAFDHIVRNAAKAAIKGSGVKMPAGNAELREAAIDRATRNTSHIGDRGDTTPTRRTRFTRDEQSPGAFIQQRRKRLKPRFYGDSIDHASRLVRLPDRFLAPGSVILAQALSRTSIVRRT